MIPKNKFFYEFKWKIIEEGVKKNEWRERMEGEKEERWNWNRLHDWTAYAIVRESRRKYLTPFSLDEESYVFEVTLNK